MGVFQDNLTPMDGINCPGVHYYHWLPVNYLMVTTKEAAVEKLIAVLSKDGRFLGWTVADVRKLANELAESLCIRWEITTSSSDQMMYRDGNWHAKPLEGICPRS